MSNVAKQTSPLTLLRGRIVARFTLDELRTLAYDLGVRYDDLRGETLTTKTQSLLEHLERHGRLPALLTHLQQQRPTEEWPVAWFDTPVPLPISPTETSPAPAPIHQQAGDQAIQIGQNYGEVIVHPPLRWSPLLWLVAVALLLAIFLLFRSFWPTAPPALPITLSSEPQTAVPTAAPSPTPHLMLDALTLPALTNTQLVDIATAGGTLWIGAREGLFWLRPGEADAQQVVAGEITAMAAHGSAGVWFALLSEDLPQFGYHRTATATIEWFTADLPLNPASFITAMATDGRDLVWLGDSTGTIYQLRLSTRAGTTLPSPASPPVEMVYGLAAEPDNLWVVGSSGVYRWQQDGWVTAVPATTIATGLINAVAAGANQRAWFGHTTGLTLFQPGPTVNLIRQECAVPDLPSTLINDLALAQEGTELWLVSRSGLAWLDARPEATPPDQCAAWQWQTWTEDGFWQTNTPPGLFRLAVDESHPGAVNVWIMRQDSSRIRWLHLPE